MSAAEIEESPAGEPDLVHVVCSVDELPPGGRKIVNIDGMSIGLFNVDGTYYAMRNGCPHKGGALCEGPIVGTTLHTDGTEFVYGKDGTIVRCAWHGWEFNIATGVALADESFRARMYTVSVDQGQVWVHT